VTSAKATVEVDPTPSGDGTVRVLVSGEVDIQTAPAVRQRLLEVANGGAPAVSLDLSSVVFADSSALAAFAAMQRIMNDRGHRLSIIGATGPMLTVLELTGIVHGAATPGEEAPSGAHQRSGPPEVVVGHELVFEGDRSAPRVARSAVTRWLGPNHPCLDDTLLVVSELVTNVVLHSGAGGELRLDPGPPIRVAIHDRSSVQPSTLATAGGHGGFGLRLVDQLSSEWGVAPDGSGKVVWVAVRERAPADS